MKNINQDKLTKQKERILCFLGVKFTLDLYYENISETEAGTTAK